MSVICPKCGGKKTKVYWEQVVFCEDCKFSSIKGENRYTLVCPKDGTRLVPRAKYSKPTMVCLKCETEYDPPGESEPEVVEEPLD